MLVETGELPTRGCTTRIMGSVRIMEILRSRGLPEMTWMQGVDTYRRKLELHKHIPLERRIKS